jgi:peroxiredoxin
MVSGPEIGERIPDFEAYDQNGNLVSLDDVMGPNGAMVVFVRSADW